MRTIISPGGKGELFHFHRSRYPHARAEWGDKSQMEFSAIVCTGKTKKECRANRIAGEISRMIEFAFRELGGNPRDIVSKHREEHPKEWE